jgi:hypothetical protein
MSDLEDWRCAGCDKPVDPDRCRTDVNGEWFCEQCWAEFEDEAAACEHALDRPAGPGATCTKCGWIPQLDGEESKELHGRPTVGGEGDALIEAEPKIPDDAEVAALMSKYSVLDRPLAERVLAAPAASRAQALSNAVAAALIETNVSTIELYRRCPQIMPPTLGDDIEKLVIHVRELVSGRQQISIDGVVAQVSSDWLARVDPR